MKKFIRSRRFLFSLIMVFAAMSITLWIACERQYQTPTEPQEFQQEVILRASDPQVRAVMDIQDRHTDELLAKTGIVGTGTGMTEDGRPAIIVFVRNDRLVKQAAIPAIVEEAPVIVQVTGEFKALKGQPVDHTARFQRPVPLGVSTGHPSITAGTIGARVTDGQGNVWALSNNHVYAATNFQSCTPGAGFNCVLGDPVIQPGRVDGGSTPADDIGNVVDFEPIDFSPSVNNVIDAAIASTTTALVDRTTTSDCYGTPKSLTIAAAVNMNVKKCGRTTGLTTGTITAINATILVNYGAPGVARFVNQIVTTNISAGGDSGSLVVFNGKGRTKQDDRRPVGLLYAGSATSTILNPIDAVLNRFGVTIDGE
jgi:hypothetical protein